MITTLWAVPHGAVVHVLSMQSLAVHPTPSLFVLKAFVSVTDARDGRLRREEHSQKKAGRQTRRVVCTRFAREADGD